MEKENELKDWVEKMVNNALHNLNLKNEINIKLEPMGDRFKTEGNSAEVYLDTLFVNYDWLKSESEKSDETEVRLLIYHEIRHIYQRLEVKKWKEGLPVNEDIAVISQWNKEFNNYIRNEGGNTTIPYYSQTIEIDAYAFGICLLLIDSKKGDKLSLSTTSIPDEIDAILRNRGSSKKVG